MTKIAIVIYSLYGHIATMAEEIKKGIEKNSGVTADIFQVAETLPQEVLTKMHAPPKPNYPIVDPAELEKYDGYAFGIPTRYGNASAQFRAFWDSTGGQWASGGFHGKMCTAFISSASQHGGQESTVLSNMSTFIHHGLIFVPLGYARAFGQLTNMTEVLGGGPYGSGTLAGGDGSRQPSALEKEIADIHGVYFGETVHKYVSGTAKVAAAAAAAGTTSTPAEKTETAAAAPAAAATDSTTTNPTPAATGQTDVPAATSGSTDTAPAASAAAAQPVAADNGKLNKRKSIIGKLFGSIKGKN